MSVLPKLHGPRLPLAGRGAAPAALLLALLLSACQPESGSGPSATADGTSPPSATSAASALPGGCSDNSPCHFGAGTYRLGDGQVMPGLQLTLPAGWSSTENDLGELNLIPLNQADDRLFFWVDMVAVKSTGAGHGTTILTNIGTTPDALTAWLTHNPDFRIVAKPASTTIGNGIPMRTLTVGVSQSARYNDSGCPSNPRCADFFTNPTYWGTKFYGIGGDAEFRLYLGSIRMNGSPHTMMIAMDAVNHADLGQLATVAKPILDSIRLPTTP